MKNILIVTYVEFWTKNAGHCARISSMINFLKDKYKITIFFAGKRSQLRLTALFGGVDFHFIETDEEVTYKVFKEKFQEYIKDRFFEVVIIEYVDLSPVLEYLHPATITILDTHDLIANKIQSFGAANLDYGGIMLTKEEELEIFDYYDYVILIQKKDYDEVCQAINRDKLLLVPHPVAIQERIITRHAKRVGYVASLYGPNINALQWFLENVWHEASIKYGFVLHVYGDINAAFNRSNFSNGDSVIFHGYVEDTDTIYNQLDIIINPIKCGAGLKIKNVEALGNGLPLITTEHGSIGMEDGISKAFLVADTREEFMLAFDHLRDYYTRKQLSDAALRFAQNNYADDKCFAGLLNAINKDKNMLILLGV